LSISISHIQEKQFASFQKQKNVSALINCHTVEKLHFNKVKEKSSNRSFFNELSNNHRKISCISSLKNFQLRFSYNFFPFPALSTKILGRLFICHTVEKFLFNKAKS